MDRRLALLNVGSKRTGVGRYTSNLIKYIPRQQWDLHLFNFNVFGSRALSEYPSAEKCATIYGLQLGRLEMLNMPINYLLCHMGRLRRNLERAGRFSLYHATTGDLNHLAGVSDKFVVTWHDTGVFKHSLSPYSRFIKWNLSFINQASHVIVSSEFAKARLHKKVGRLPQRLSVIPLAAGDEFRPISRVEARRRLGLPVDGQIILSIGRDWYPRNIVTLLKAMNHLKGVKLVRVGKLFMSVNAWRQVENKQDLILRENAEDSELAYYYNAADAFVFPSIHEGFELEPLEAIKCGIPVITTRMGALEEVVGSSALFMKNPLDPVEIAELVTYLLGSKGLRESLRATGIEWASRFSWEETTRKTLQVYEDVSFPE